MASIQTAVVTIASGATESSVLPLRNVRELSIIAPATLTGTITVYAGTAEDAAGDFAAIQSPPGTDVTVAADKATVMTSAPFKSIQLISSLAEAATRLFTVMMVVGE